MNTGKKESDWGEYYSVIKDRPARDTLVRALSLFEKEQRKGSDLFAIDLGCGSGPDTAELLKNGFRVFASDKEPQAIEILKSKFSESILSGKLKVKAVSFENILLPKSDFINASYTLPFCKPEYFDKLWEKITASLKLKGRFAGNFFGEKDSWADSRNMTFHTKQNVKSMLKKFDTEFFEEKDEDGKTATGNDKHWHVFSVVAKKIKS